MSALVASGSSAMPKRPASPQGRETRSRRSARARAPRRGKQRVGAVRAPSCITTSSPPIAKAPARLSASQAARKPHRRAARRRAQECLRYSRASGFGPRSGRERHKYSGGGGETRMRVRVSATLCRRRPVNRGRTFLASNFGIELRNRRQREANNDQSGSWCAATARGTTWTTGPVTPMFPALPGRSGRSTTATERRRSYSISPASARKAICEQARGRRAGLGLSHNIRDAYTFFCNNYIADAARRVGAARKAEQENLVALAIIVADERVGVAHIVRQAETQRAAGDLAERVAFGADTGLIEHDLRDPCRSRSSTGWIAQARRETLV